MALIEVVGGILMSKHGEAEHEGAGLVCLTLLHGATSLGTDNTAVGGEYKC